MTAASELVSCIGNFVIQYHLIVAEVLPHASYKCTPTDLHCCVGNAQNSASTPCKLGTDIVVKWRTKKQRNKGCTVIDSLVSLNQYSVTSDCI